MNILPPSFKFDGDKDKSMSLKSYAGQFYRLITRQAAKEGLPHVNRTKRFPDGTTIIVHAQKHSLFENWSGRVQIITVTSTPSTESNGIYLESGYIDLVSAATCNINTARPGLLNYTGSVNNYIINTTTPLQSYVTISAKASLEEFPFTGKVIDGGSESLSIGCSKKVGSARDSCGNIYTVPEEDITTLGFCPIDDILRKKKAISNIPSSFFSGKLRLMVQALYGSRRTDYSVVEVEGVILPGKLEVAGFQLSAMFVPSYGIYTTPDFEYFLVEVTTNQIKYYPILLSSIAKQFVSILKVHDRKAEKAFAKRVEAYILSTATIDTDNVIIGDTITDLVGEPLGYGWHWSWDGHQADIVLHTPNTTNHYYDVVHQRLTFTRVDGVFSASLSTVESGYWFPQHLSGIAVFFPNYFSNNFQAMAPVWEELNNGIPVPQTTGSIPLSPLHCFRSMSDELIVIRHESNLTVKNDTINEIDNIGCVDEDMLFSHDATNNGVFGTDSLSLGAVSYNGMAYNTKNESDIHSIPVGGLAFLQDDVNSSGNYTHLSAIMCGGMRLDEYLVSTGYFAWHPSGGIGTSFDPETGMTYGLRHFTQDRIRTYESSSFNTQMNTEIFLQLPFYDCTSVLWGYRDITVKTNYITGQDADPRDVYGGASIWQFHLEGGIYTPVTEVVAPKLAQTDGIGGFNTTYNAPININIKVGYANLYRYDGADGNELIHTETSSSPLSAYFDISYLNYPFIDQFDWVRSDTSGGYKWTYKITASDDTKYPGDGAIGWV